MLVLVVTPLGALAFRHLRRKLEVVLGGHAGGWGGQLGCILTLDKTTGMLDAQQTQ